MHGRRYQFSVFSIAPGKAGLKSFYVILSSVNLLFISFDMSMDGILHALTYIVVCLSKKIAWYGLILYDF